MGCTTHGLWFSLLGVMFQSVFILFISTVFILFFLMILHCLSKQLSVYPFTTDRHTVCLGLWEVWLILPWTCVCMLHVFIYHGSITKEATCGSHSSTMFASLRSIKLFSKVTASFYVSMGDDCPTPLSSLGMPCISFSSLLVSVEWGLWGLYLPVPKHSRSWASFHVYWALANVL